MMRWQVLILMFLIGLEARSNRSRMRQLLWRIEKCGLSEELRFCRPTCEPTCAKLHPICPATCGLAVCMCERGFVRQSGLCIPMSACKFFDFAPQTKRKVAKRNELARSTLTKSSSKPAVLTRASNTAVVHRPLRPPPSCGQGQQFTSCVCDATCNRNKVCDTCSSGCGCFLHHVRNDEGICVLFRDCPHPRPRTKPTAMVLFSSIPKKSTISSRHVEELTLFKRETIKNGSAAFRGMEQETNAQTIKSVELYDTAYGSTIRMITTPPLARAVKTDKRTVPSTGSKRRLRRPTSVSKRIRQQFGKISKATKTVRGPQPPAFAPRLPGVSPSETVKAKIIVRPGETEPAPPATIPPKLKPMRRGPPSARPLRFGPPGITPVAFFRSRRIARKERVLRRLKMLSRRRHVV